MSAIRNSSRARAWLVALALCLAVPTLGLAQGNEATSAASRAEGPQQGDTVEIGAGSTAAVTTGSSGPGSSSSPTVTPVAGGFSIRPPQNEFAGPGMLPIRAPHGLRCELIGDRQARERCAHASGTK